MRRRRDLLGAGGLAVLAVAYLVANRAYPLDTLATPGPGVFPLAAGLLLLGLAVCQAVLAARAGPEAAAAAPADQGAPVRASALMAVLVGFAVAAGTVGFLTASFGLVLVASRLLGARDWLRPAALALGVTIAAYVIFIAWLGVPLPAGLLP
jgi:Tripartite tricarboxylate transporter TctB family